MNEKRKCGHYIDSQLLERVLAISRKIDIEPSEIHERALRAYFAKNPELTTLERKKFQEVTILALLDGVLSVFSLTGGGSLSQKFDMALYTCHGFSIHLPLREFSKIAELSIFEALFELKDYDKNLFEEKLKMLGKFGRMRKRYLALYPMVLGQKLLDE